MRDEQHLLQLRPMLNLSSSESKPEEQFQNQTLRPILKMQHELLVRLFFAKILQHKGVFFQLPREGRSEWIAQTLRADQRLRQLLLGAVIGHFTLAELKVFEADAPELRRRLLQLLIQRLQSVDFEPLLKQ